MQRRINTIILNDSQYINSATNVYFHYAWKTMISLQWKFNDTNETYTAPAGNGDHCISHSAIQVDGDLILSVGWSDGFAVRRLNDDGTLTDIYSDTKPLNNYGYYNSIALDKTRKMAWVSSYATNGFQTYDYSGAVNGGTTVTKGASYTTTDGFPCTDSGGPYQNGLYIVGDYLYITPDDRNTGNSLYRMRLSDLTADHLTIDNYRYNPRFGEFYYDETNNRLYRIARTNGEYVIILNPDKSSTDPTSPARAINLGLSYLGLGDDVLTPLIAVDKTNPNILFVGGYHGRRMKVDITPVIDGIDTKPTIIWNDWRSTQNQWSAPSWLWGYNSGRPHPTYGSDFIIIRPDRDWYMEFGWWDQENMIPVGPPRYYSWAYHSSKHAYTYRGNDTLIYSYAPFPALATSAGGNTYMILSGYGWDGYKFRTWTPDKYELETSGYIIFGPFSFSDSANIHSVRINNLKDQLYIPSGTTFTAEVSNNNGAIWELYDYSQEDRFHVFQSTGNQLLVKFTFNGMPTKAPHINGVKHLVIDFAERWDNVDISKVAGHARLLIKGV